MLFLYDLFLSLYYIAIKIYTLFNNKAKKWIEGRKGWEQHIRSEIRAGERRIWIHCSSMGEFEQAKPLIEALREKYPEYKIVVTFFSPSGYDACKNSPLADYIFYLPHDSRRNAERFISIIDPALTMFVKYEFWYYYLTQLKKQRIPTLLISGAFRAGQPFFNWYGGIFREMLGCFSFYFLQDEASRDMLGTIGIDKNIKISGDTRYDRVSVISKSVTPIESIEKFKGDYKILIGGSTWPGDEDVLKECISSLPANWKLIIVPHEIGEAHIRKVQQLFVDSILYSELDAENIGQDKKVLIINNIGMLSRLFAYADIAFIGGGFQKGGIHNILEPAVFGVPVIFGPIFDKFVEAKTLVSLHYVFPVNNSVECQDALKKMITDEEYRRGIGYALSEFMKTNVGATKTIMDEIAKEKWLN